MTCPECGFRVTRGALLAASGLFAIVCPRCAAKLRGTLESRVRLSALSFLAGMTVGVLAESLGAPLLVAIALGMIGLTVWYVHRAETTLILEEAAPRITRFQE